MIPLQRRFTWLKEAFERKYLDVKGELTKTEDRVKCYTIQRAKGCEHESDRTGRWLKSYKEMLCGPVIATFMGTAKVRFGKHEEAEIAKEAWDGLSWIVTDKESEHRRNSRNMRVTHSQFETYFKHGIANAIDGECPGIEWGKGREV